MPLISTRAAAVTAVVSATLVLAACTGEGPVDVSPSATPVPTATATASPSPSATPSVTPEPTSTPSPTASPTDDGAEPGGTGDVSVVITRAGVTGGDFEVGGYVDGVVEEGGTCTATLTGADGAQVMASGPGLLNASTTSCGAGLTFAASTVSGTWELILSYSSPKHDGRSAAQDVVIP